MIKLSKIKVNIIMYYILDKKYYIILSKKHNSLQYIYVKKFDKEDILLKLKLYINNYIKNFKIDDINKVTYKNYLYKDKELEYSYYNMFIRLDDNNKEFKKSFDVIELSKLLKQTNNPNMIFSLILLLKNNEKKKNVLTDEKMSENSVSGLTSYESPSHEKKDKLVKPTYPNSINVAYKYLTDNN